MSLEQLRAMSIGAAPCSTDRQAQKVVMVKEDPCTLPQLPATQSNPINLKYLNGAAEQVIQFEIENNGANPATVIIGLGVYGTEGYAGLINIDDAAADLDTVTSDGNPNVKNIQAFNFRTNAHAVIASKVQVFDASNEAQRGKQMKRIMVDINGNITNLRTKYVETDTDTNYSTIAGTTVFSYIQGIRYEILAGQSAKIEIEVLGVADIEDFTVGL